MRKAIALLLVAFVCLAGVAAGGSGEGGSSGDTYKIGFIGPLTGDNANYGIRCSNAARLAIDEINAAGGIGGKTLELIAEDSEGTVDKALASYEKLAYMDNVCAIIGPVFTSPALAVAQRCQEDGIVMISPSATHKVASLYAMNDYSQGLALGMKETFESLGGEVVAEETCMVGDKDFRAQLTQIRSAGPEAVYIPNYTVEDALILEQASQLGLNVQFLSSDGFSDPEIYNLAPDFTDGVVYVGPAQAEASTKLADFQAAYAAAYNGDAPDSFATNSYDATYIIAGAIERAGSADTMAIRNEVAATKDFQGANGTMNFAANGDLVASQGVYDVEGITPVYVGAFQIVDGHIVQVD